MNRVILVIKITILLLALLTSVGCGISAETLRATMEAEVRPTVATEARQTAVVEIRTAVAATQTAVVATQDVALLSVHGQYVTALGEDDEWALGQKTELDPCGKFIQHHLANGKIALETCYGRYVTAPESGTEESDWLLGQDPELSDCGQFDLYDLGRDSVAFRTCAGRFFTPGDYTWDPGLKWKIKAQTDYVDAWEIFTVQQP